MPERVQLRRTKGWRMPPNTVKVCRPGKWGNPFVVGKRYGWGEPGSSEIEGPFTPIKDRKEAVAVYRSWLDDQHDLMDAVGELRGKNLACWCPAHEPCHADVLLKLANA